MNPADQSDPEKNYNFGRRWSEAPMSAAEIDRVADHFLHLGHHLTAERLSRQAAAMREVAQWA